MCPDENALAALVDGLLSPAEIQGIEDHLDTCDACLDLVASIARSDDAEPEPGAHIGRFSVLHPLGSGAHGVVVAAYDPELQRQVAIKLVRPDRAADQKRVWREARMLASLSHTNVVRVYEIGQHQGAVFLVTEVARGGTLRSRGAGPWAEVGPAWLGAGRGLAAAHRAGLVHRDVKPDNFVLHEDGRAMLADFGLATASGAAAAAAGTPLYLAPEVGRGEPATPRSDQYAFCLCVRGAVRSPPRRVARALARGLSADPARRFDDMDALLAALEPRSPGPWLAAALGATALGATALVGSWALVRPDAPVPTPTTGPAAPSRPDDPLQRRLDRAVGNFAPSRQELQQLSFFHDELPRRVAEVDAAADALLRESPTGGAASRARLAQAEARSAAAGLLHHVAPPPGASVVEQLRWHHQALDRILPAARAHRDDALARLDALGPELAGDPLGRRAEAVRAALAAGWVVEHWLAPIPVDVSACDAAAAEATGARTEGERARTRWVATCLGAARRCDEAREWAARVGDAPPCGAPVAPLARMYRRTFDLQIAGVRVGAERALAVGAAARRYQAAATSDEDRRDLWEGEVLSVVLLSGAGRPELAAEEADRAEEAFGIPIDLQVVAAIAAECAAAGCTRADADRVVAALTR
ncbi:MAG: protein kinase [Myxococcota bacterium]